MARRKPASKVKRASGPTQPESDRKAGAVLLRLLPAAERELRRRATKSGMTMSAVVSALLMASTAEES